MDKYFAPERISQNMSMTPEGFLLCEAVPVARIGSQIYGAEELGGLDTPIPPNSEGIVEISRTPEELFNEVTLASANGKDVVDEHPDDTEDQLFDVDSGNYRYITRGVMVNPRRGKGADSDVMLADLLIKDKEAIEEVRGGKREVSLGYRAEYFKLDVGKGEQRNIFINHVALVKAGRCGSRCSVRDHNHSQSQEQQMSKNRSWADKIRHAFMTKDEKMMNEALEEAPRMKDEEPLGAGAIHIHNHMGKGPAGETVVDDAEAEADIPEYFKKHVEENNARFAELGEKIGKMTDGMAEMGKLISGGTKKEGDDMTEEEATEMEAEAPEGMTRDSIRKARDSAHLEDSFERMVADAEIIAPGVTFPIFTRDAAPTATHQSMCRFRRTVLELGYMQPETRGVMEEVLAGKPLQLADMKCSKVRDTFSAVAAARRAANRAAVAVSGVRDNRRDVEQEPNSEVPHDNVAMNRYIADFYTQKNA